MANLLLMRSAFETKPNWGGGTWGDLDGTDTPAGGFTVIDADTRNDARRKVAVRAVATRLGVPRPKQELLDVALLKTWIEDITAISASKVWKRLD